MKLIYARDAVWTPWKNGGGVTRQIAAWPDHSGLEDFGWRISTARVESSGPFSHFDGIDRTLAVLEGRLRFRRKDDAETVIGATDDAIAFPGEAAVEAGPAEGPVLDFNVMTRRGRFRHELTRRRLSDGESLQFRAAPSGWTLVYVIDGQPRMDGTGQSSRLRCGDALLMAESNGPVSLSSSGDTSMIVVEIRPDGT